MRNLTLKQALKIIHSLGYASKMPCYSYSTSAFRCQRGSKLAKIPGTICNKCYAKRGNFCRPTIQAGLDARMKAMEHPRWSEAMALVLTRFETSGYFRWFASGDIQSLGDLVKICDVARRTPNIKHWLPTHEAGILGSFVRAGFTFPPNMTVRLSADFIGEKPNRHFMRELNVQGSAVNKDRFNCPASLQDNMCGTCRKCWHKSVPIVTYKYH